MKEIEVSAAVIIKDNKILVTARGYGDFKGYYEFPGGKLEKNESPESCLIREIKEELNATIIIKDFLKTITYDYDKFRLKMHVFMCTLKDDKFELLEHLDAKYVSISELEKIRFLPADFQLIEPIKNYFETVL